MARDPKREKFISDIISEDDTTAWLKMLGDYPVLEGDARKIWSVVQLLL